MLRLPCRSRPAGYALVLATALLAGALLQTTCQITLPDMSLDMDDQAIHLEAPGLTVHIEPGNLEDIGSSIQAYTQ